MKKRIILTSLVFLLFCAMLVLEVIPHVQKAKAMKNQIASLEHYQKSFSDMFGASQDFYEDNIESYRKTYRSEIVAIVRCAVIGVSFIAACWVSFLPFLSRVRYEQYRSRREAKRAERQEKKRRRLQEKLERISKGHESES